MNKFFWLILVMLSTQSAASTNVGCAKVGASMYIGLTDTIIEDLNISRNQIIQNKVSVDIISVSPITKVYAEQLAKKEYKKLNKHILILNNYIEDYSTDNTEVINAKYIYRNEKD